MNNLPTETNVRKRYLTPTLKLLFIEAGLEEKVAASQLEALTSRLLGIQCSFSVVPSCFLGLEACEHTDFDGVFVCGHSLKHLSAFEFMRIYRTVGGLAPIFIMSEYYDEIEIEDWQVDGIPKTKYEHMDPPRFNGKLHKPFTKKELCSTIVQIYQTLYASQLMVPTTYATELSSPNKRPQPFVDNVATAEHPNTTIAPELLRVAICGTDALSGHLFQTSSSLGTFSNDEMLLSPRNSTFRSSADSVHRALVKNSSFSHRSHEQSPFTPLPTPMTIATTKSTEDFEDTEADDEQAEGKGTKRARTMH